MHRYFKTIRLFWSTAFASQLEYQLNFLIELVAMLGTVIDVQKRRMMGRSGDLNLSIDYMLIDGKRVRLRASQSGKGSNKIAATAVLTYLFGPLGLLKRGKDVEQVEFRYKVLQAHKAHKVVEELMVQVEQVEEVLQDLKELKDLKVHKVM